jgi:DNA-binding SARP family transcriptional activator
MLRFNVLGPLTALRDGITLDLGAQKQKSVLAVLIAEMGHVVDTDRIIEAVWAEAASPSARRSVQTYVSALRKALGDQDLEILVAGDDQRPPDCRRQL